MGRFQADDVKKIADVVRLNISDEDAEKYADQLGRLISLADELNEVDTDSVEPTTHILQMKNIFREDIAQEGLPIEDVLKNVPEHEDRQIKVPTILE